VHYYIEDNDIFSRAVSSDPLLTTIWANPEFCPDSWLDFYWPSVGVEFQHLLAFLTIHASSPGPFPFM